MKLRPAIDILTLALLAFLAMGCASQSEPTIPTTQGVVSTVRSSLNIPQTPGDALGMVGGAALVWWLRRCSKQ
jgi:hypothetical protein